MTKSRILSIFVIAIIILLSVFAGIVDYVLDMRENEIVRVTGYAETYHARRNDAVDEYINSHKKDLDIITNTLESLNDGLFTSDNKSGDYHFNDGRVEEAYKINIIPNNVCTAIMSSYKEQKDVDSVIAVNMDGEFAHYNSETNKYSFYSIKERDYFIEARDNKAVVIDYVDASIVWNRPAIIIAEPVIRNDVVDGVIIVVVYAETMTTIINDETEDSINLNTAVVDNTGKFLSQNDNGETSEVIKDLYNNNYSSMITNAKTVNATYVFELDSSYAYVNQLGLSQFARGEWYLVSTIDEPNLLRYSDTYTQRTVLLLAFTVVITFLFTIMVLTIAAHSYKQKSVLDKKQGFVMSKIKKYMFDINPKSQIITFTPDTQKLLGLKHPTMRFEEVRSSLTLSQEEKDKLSDIFQKLQSDNEITTELSLFSKHLKAEIYHIVSKEDNLDCFSGVLEDITPIVIKQQLLEQRASTDGLTKLLNREAIMMEVEKNITTDPASRKSVYVIDIDDFKQINDKYGHYVGDILLQKTAAVLTSISVGKNIKIGRLGGDEFCVFYYGGPSNKEIKEFAALLCNKLSLITISNEVDYYISCSVGVSRYPRNGMNFAELYQKADNALYLAKENYGSCYVFYEDDAYVSENAENELDTEEEIIKPKSSTQGVEDNFSLLLSQGAEGSETLRNILLKAVESNEFVCYKQPKINVHTGEIASEALSRWYNPTFGMIAPNRFILLFERTNSIEALDMYMLEFTLKDLNQRIQKHIRVETISVNQSLQTITQPYYFNKVLSMLKKYDVPTGLVTIEITERGLFTSLRTIIKVINKLHDCGFKISIDDFGSGFTTLSILKDLEVDEIKIDKSFMTADLRNGGKANIIIKQITKMAHELGIEVVAEGVENIEQAKALAEIGIDYLQGYLISKPVTFADFDRACKSGDYSDKIIEITEGKVLSARDYYLSDKNQNYLGNAGKKKPPTKVDPKKKKPPTKE